LEKIGHFEIHHKLNAGGTASVFFGTNIFKGYPVAIKILNSSLFKNKLVFNKFKEEANNYLYLNHPNIVKLKDLYLEDNKAYLIMEYLDGKNIRDFLKDVTGPMPLQNVALIINEVLSALKYVHDRNLIHMDIKSQNIMITDSNDVKIIDFGISQQTEKQQKQIMGSPYYMSPEQIKNEAIDHRSDIYSIGITMYEMITGDLPFKNNGSRNELFEQIKNNNVPEIIRIRREEEHLLNFANYIISKSTHKNREERYDDCSEFMNDLKKIIENEL